MISPVESGRNEATFRIQRRVAATAKAANAVNVSAAIRGAMVRKRRLTFVFNEMKFMISDPSLCLHRTENGAGQFCALLAQTADGSTQSDSAASAGAHGEQHGVHQGIAVANAGDFVPRRV